MATHVSNSKRKNRLTSLAIEICSWATAASTFFMLFKCLTAIF